MIVILGRVSFVFIVFFVVNFVTEKTGHEGHHVPMAIGTQSPQRITPTN